MRTWLVSSVMFAALLVGCKGGAHADADGDGVEAATDCDDADATIGGPQTWYADVDADHHGDGTVSVEECVRPAGMVSVGDDCDDASPQVSPSASEGCNGKDDDCDGIVDDGAPLRTLYTDADGDSYGDPDGAVQACTVLAGLVSNTLDCDDSSAAVFPGAVETCDGIDDDCDGRIDIDAVDEVVTHADADGDGFGSQVVTVTACVAPEGYVADGSDCDDTDAGVNPDAAELCDGLDEDCDGVVDTTAVDRLTWWRDVDHDGFGDSGHPTQSCDPPTGYVDNDADCNDADARLTPATVWYTDADGDGFGDPATAVAQCAAPASAVSNGLDCDDTRVAVAPGALERCDGFDNDCDGFTDNEAAIDAPRWFADADGDGYGNAANSGVSCIAPNGYLADGSDCDDRNVAIYPGAVEICDHADDNCNGLADDEDPGAVDPNTWYADADGDTFGDPLVPKYACDQPRGYVADAQDCDDRDDDINPNATEYCNGGFDDDCDGLIDNADPSNAGDATWYADRDLDGYGSATDVIGSCGYPAGYVNDSGDCDDSEPLVHPGLVEICGNGLDDNCDHSAGVCGFDDPVSLADAQGDVSGQTYEELGWSLAGVGDVDGDGFDDFVTGAYYGANYAGAAVVISGTLAGHEPRNGASTIAFLKGDGTWTYAGYAVGGGGDLTGDGVPDVLVGAYGYDSGVNYDAGATYVISGTATGSGSVNQGFRITGDRNYQNSGCSMDVAGDVDGDGNLDLIIGGYGDGNANMYYSGSAWIMNGPISRDGSIAASGIKLTGESSSSYAGSSVASAGDWDGDGRADVVVGARQAGPTYQGRVYVFVDPPTGVSSLADAALILTGVSSYNYAGTAVDSGDFNGDGYSDVLLGASGESAAYVQLGPQTGNLSLRFGDAWLYGSGGGNAGTSVANAGDVDGDGSDDVLIGAPYAGRNSEGSAYLVFHPADSVYTDLETDAIEFVGKATYDNLGQSVAGIGDANADGYADFAIGVPNDDGVGYSSGSAYVFLGKGL
jgi:hypothetical protein